MKVGRNDLCPCGSGKKYKKCCIGKDETTIINSGLDLYAYHRYCTHAEKVKEPKINQKLLNIYDNNDKMSQKEIVDNWLEVMDYILNYAKKNNIHTLEELDDEKIVAEFMGNLVGDFEMEIYNLDKEDYDLNITISYLDKIVNTLNLDDHTYEEILRCKTWSLFKLGNYDLGEEVMLNLIKEKNNSIYPYVELVDCYQFVKNMDKAKYYYDLGMKQTNLDDLDVLEQRLDFFEK